LLNYSLTRRKANFVINLLTKQFRISTKGF
jgi:hypothetical protein